MSMATDSAMSDRQRPIRRAGTKARFTALSHCWYLMADPEGNEFCVVGD